MSNSISTLEVSLDDLINHYSGQLFIAENIEENNVFLAMKDEDITSLKTKERLKEKGVTKVIVYYNENLYQELTKVAPEKYAHKYFDKRVKLCKKNELEIGMILRERLESSQNKVVAKKWEKVTPLLKDVLKEQELSKEYYEVFVPDKIYEKLYGLDLDKIAPKKKVLLVDDEEIMLFTLAKGLEMFGFEVLTISNPEEVVLTLRKEHIDIVILDLIMPKLSGLEVLERIKSFEYLKKIPVMMLTAHRLIPYIVKATKLGAVDYLVKPVNVKELAKRVGKILNINVEKAIEQETGIDSKQIDELLNQVPKDL